MNEPRQKPPILTRISLILAGALSVIAGPPAMAQTPDQTESTGLEEIIVTARFREESLQETPIAITAITADELTARGMQSAYEVAYTVPNASLRPAQAAFGASMTAYIRGIGQYDFLPEFEPGVAIYFDDVLHPVTFGSMIDLMDLERVEVLRGPQGTLFGRGSIGGAIRYISKAPQGDDTGNVSVTYGSYNRVDIRASYDFKITDTVFARVSGVSKKRDGYQGVIDFACAYPHLAGYNDGLAADGAAGGPLNGAPDAVLRNSAADNAFALPRRTQNRESNCKIGTQGGEEVTGARAALRFAPSDKFDLTFTGVYMNDSSEARADTLVHVGRNPMTGALPVPFNFWSGGSATYGVPYDNRFIAPSIYETYATFDDPTQGYAFNPKTSFEDKSISAKADIHFTDTMMLELIGSYSEFEGRFATDADGSPLNEQLVDGIQFVTSKTAEARLSGLAFDKLDWTVGAYWYQGDFVNSQQVMIPPFVPMGLLVNGHNQTTSENLSGFVHTNFHVSDNFSLSAGARYSTDQKDEDFDNSIVVTQLDTDESRVDWKVGADYKFGNGMMIYGSAATGYRPQAFNPRPFQPTQFVQVDGEEATSYELGFKSDFAENRVRVNLAGFYVDYNQRILPVGGTECTLLNPMGPPPYVYNTIPPATGTPIVDSLGQNCVAVTSRTFYINVPATITGAELEVSVVPVDGLTISGQYGFTDFQGDEFDDPSLLQNPNVTEITSENPIYVPENNWSMSASYKFNVGDSGSITPRFDYVGQSVICTGIRTNASVLAIDTTEDQACSDGYELNARLEWASPEDTWRLALGATNLTGEEYYLNKFDLSAFGQPTVEGQPGHPREWYLQFTRNFN